MLVPSLYTGDTSASFNTSGKLQDWIIKFGMFATLLKERSDVISNMQAGTSPLAFSLSLGCWSHPIPQNTQIVTA